jgi:hypothetical protein
VLLNEPHLFLGLVSYCKINMASLITAVVYSSPRCCKCESNGISSIVAAATVASISATPDAGVDAIIQNDAFATQEGVRDLFFYR